MSSANDTFPTPLQLPISPTELERINDHLRPLPPQEILLWAERHLPSLYQTTAFGLTGLVALDMLSRLPRPPQQRQPPLIFIDTLYHFPETYALVEEVKARYKGVELHVYKPFGCADVGEFERMYGEKFWERDEEAYDWAVKVEPAQRAYRELDVKSVITGRRASQGAARASLQPLEVDGTGLMKLNPLFAWTFADVRAYVDSHAVPRNALLGRGYKSVGDWHSTLPSGEGNGDGGERAGRWAGREDKTECGLHVEGFNGVRERSFKLGATATV